VIIEYLPDEEGYYILKDMSENKLKELAEQSIIMK
jgi:hypothetical protein